MGNNNSSDKIKDFFNKDVKFFWESGGYWW